MLADYLAAYPEMSAELILSDHVVDLVEEGFDVAVRIGALPDSGLVARPLAPYAMLICAAPAYLARAGTPRSVAELAHHACLGFTHWRHRGWRLGADEQHHVLPSRFECNHGPALRMTALQGLGLVMLPRVLVAADVAAGRLTSVLQEALPPPLPTHLVYPRNRQALPKLRTFVDFAVQRFAGSLDSALDGAQAPAPASPPPSRPRRPARR